ncbi:hypothetical protein, partial [Bacillus atrophaeus]|uniref:hypothetical protein n=1 Tax=Bacillus atrophaeus TaxID=1452 RepID=UPI001A7E0D24
LSGDLTIILSFDVKVNNFFEVFFVTQSMKLKFRGLSIRQFSSYFDFLIIHVLKHLYTPWRKFFSASPTLTNISFFVVTLCISDV